jgi:hypothetical protein
MTGHQIVVPLNSPASRHYLQQGWVLLRAMGNWAVLSRR